MPYRPNGLAARTAMYNTPAIRNGGFGALQVEALTNRPLSIARRHFAASQLRMRAIEPDELSSSEWVRFLVMEEEERERWITQFLVRRQRRDSDESTASVELDSDTALSKAEEARLEAAQEASRDPTRASSSSAVPVSAAPSQSSIHPASLWVRQYESSEASSAAATNNHTELRPVQHRRVVAGTSIEAPPTYESVIRASTPPPAYQSRLDYDRAQSPSSS